MAGGHTDCGLVHFLSGLAPKVLRGSTAIDVVRIAAEGLAAVGMSVAAFNLVDGELLALFISDDRGLRSAERCSSDPLFRLRARVEPGGPAFGVLADGEAVYKTDFDPFATFFGSKTTWAGARSNAVVAPVFLGNIPWGIVVFASPTLHANAAPAMSLFSGQVSCAIALAECAATVADLEEEVVQRERLASIGELAATLTHEIRNPLGTLFNSIASLRQILRRDFDQTARANAQTLITILNEETQRLDAISTDLLTLARPTAVRRRDTAIEVLLTTIANMVPDLVEEHAPVEVELDLAPDLPLIMVDDRLIHQALLNLVINAVQAMPKGGLIFLRGRLDFSEGGPFAVLEVTDTGSGILPEHHGRIFEPFFTTKPSGTGLGLPLVKRVVEGHRGRLTVTTGRGGSTFTIRLPLPNDGESHVTLKPEARGHLRVVGTAG